MSEKKVIISPDTKRQERVPPGQYETKKWPVLHYGSVPGFDKASWDFRVLGLVEQPLRMNHAEFFSLPRVQVKGDFHCVTTWSKLDNLWEGVSVHEILKRVKVKPEAQYVLAHCEHGFTANLPLSDFVQEDVLFAMKHNGEDLTPEHGYPLRLMVPRLYAWKSAKWLRGIEFLEKDRPGFWEQNGYHMRGDPWTEERHREY